MTLFAHLKIQHDQIATYVLLVDKAVLLGHIGAARILTTIAKQAEETAAKAGRLIHELLIEMARDTGSSTEVAVAGGGAATPHTTAGGLDAQRS
jgi:ferritin-like metal-binding protein YciE